VILGLPQKIEYTLRIKTKWNSIVRSYPLEKFYGILASLTSVTLQYSITIVVVQNPDIPSNYMCILTTTDHPISYICVLRLTATRIASSFFPAHSQNPNCLTRRTHVFVGVWMVRIFMCYIRFWEDIYITLFPRMKQSPCFALSCPSTYSSACSIAMFIYPSRHAKIPR